MKERLNLTIWLRTLLRKNTILAVFLLAFSSYPNIAESKDIYINYPENKRSFSEAAISIKNHLENQKDHIAFDKVILVTDSSGEINNLKKDDLLVNLGIFYDTNVKTLYSFFSEYQFNSQSSLPKNSHWHAILLEDSIETSIKIADKLLVNKYNDKILIAVSESNQYILNKINQSIKDITIENGVIDLIIISENDSPAKTIDQHLKYAGAIIAVRDSFVWSAKNARWILHQTYNYQVPVVGYSESFLKAGALTSIFSTKEDVIESTVKLIEKWTKTGEVGKKAISFPKKQIDFNDNIGEALGFSRLNLLNIKKEIE